MLTEVGIASSTVLPAAASNLARSMWRSKASSALMLVVTLAMIKHFSKPESTDDHADMLRPEGVWSGAKIKPRVDIVSTSKSRRYVADARAVSSTCIEYSSSSRWVRVHWWVVQVV